MWDFPWPTASSSPSFVYRGDKTTIPQCMVQRRYESVDWTTGYGLDPPFKNEVPRLLESGK